MIVSSMITDERPQRHQRRESSGMVASDDTTDCSGKPAWSRCPPRPVRCIAFAGCVESKPDPDPLRRSWSTLRQGVGAVPPESEGHWSLGAVAASEVDRVCG